MKRRCFTVWMIVFAFLLQSGASTIIVVRFEMNRATIAQTQCVQRFVKGNKCCGKCQLKKQLAAEERRENQSLNLESMKFDAVFSKQEKYVPGLFPFLTIKQFDHYSANLSKGAVLDLLRPPGIRVA